MRRRRRRRKKKKKEGEEEGRRRRRKKKKKEEEEETSHSEIRHNAMRFELEHRDQAQAESRTYDEARKPRTESRRRNSNNCRSERATHVGRWHQRLPF